MHRSDVFTSDPLGADGRSAVELVQKLREEFPDLLVESKPRKRGTRLTIRSRSGSRLDLDVVYPSDVDATNDAVRQMLRDDSVRDRVTDLLVTEMGGYGNLELGNAPYILRWLILSQHVLVTVGDDTSVEPVLRSLSLAVLRTARRRLKVWRDGAAVLHFVDDRGGAERALGVDLTRISLKEFQAAWFASLQSSAPESERLRETSFAATDSEAAAIDLLLTYADGAWLRHRRFAADALTHVGGVAIDWHAANRLTTVDTEATVQDRAVLAVACHLSGHVDPDVSLADALHFVGDARELVLESMGRVAGTHPDPGGTWPTNCSPSCP